jgi:hypothetical protein
MRNRNSNRDQPMDKKDFIGSFRKINPGNDAKLVLKMNALGVNLSGCRVEHSGDCPLVNYPHRSCTCQVAYMDSNGRIVS